MQSCLKCGWDTRSGSRICAACRTAEKRTETTADPTSEKEALLAAVLQSAHAGDPGLADDATTGDIPLHGIGAGSEPQVSEEEPYSEEAPYYEHVTLREIPPGDQGAAPPAARSESEAVPDTADGVAADTDRDPSEVSASLVDAFDDAQALRRPDAVQDARTLREPESNGTSRIGEDTADDLAALFDGPTPWDKAPADDPPSVHAAADHTTAPAPQGHDTTPPPGIDTTPPPSSGIEATLPPPDIEATLPPPDIEATLPPPDIEARPPTPHRDTDTTPPPSYGHDTAEDLAALFNAPAPWDTAPPRASASAEPDVDIDPLPDLYEPAAYTHSTGDIAPPDQASTELDEPTDGWHTGDLDTGRSETESKNTTYSPSEWPWVGRSGDGGFWAPPPEGHAAASRGYSSTANTPTSGVHENGTNRHGPMAPASAANSSGSSTPEHPGEQTSAPESDRGFAERMRAGFVELGGWTAVAQVALLAVGMLCIIQVFVLIVVSSYLSEARGQEGEIVAGSLAAHAKVDGVMLPALLVFTVITLIFAVWRSFASRGSASNTPAGILGRPLGVPMALWRVLLAAITLLLVIIPGAPPSVGAAQRITQWAMVACAVLGAACFAAPRGLDPSLPATTGDSAGTKTGAKADAAAVAGSRPAA